LVDNRTGRELDEWDVNGMTPLLYAVFTGDVDRVRQLLEMGADPNRPSSEGGTPLWHAEDDFGLVEIAAMLRQYGATTK
jgi:ankyrin repeat protein